MYLHINMFNTASRTHYTTQRSAFHVHTGIKCHMHTLTESAIWKLTTDKVTITHSKQNNSSGKYQQKASKQSTIVIVKTRQSHRHQCRC